MKAEQNNQSLSNERILVTGGSGFIGSNFIHYMLNKYPDISITNLDSLTYAGTVESLQDIAADARYTFIKGDICDRRIVDSAVKECDIIVHFAAESHVDRSINNPESFIQTNVLGTFNLLDASRCFGNKRFHHISTDEVFGSLSEVDPPFVETTAYSPRSPYSASKAASDHLVLAYYHTFGLPVTISNCSNNYGPYQFPEKLIPLAITNILQGKKVPVYGNGEQVRDWLYVGDHCKAIDLILEKGCVGEVYCVGGGSEKMNIEVVRDIAKLLQKGEEVFESVSDRPGHDRRYAINYTKIHESLGWKPEVSFVEGIEKTVEWYKNNEHWWRPLLKK